MIRVLIVEDDKFAREGLIHSMPWQQHGMEIAAGLGNGKAALEFLREHPVDLIISDFSMPIMSGLELLEAVREQYPAIEFVMITLYESFDIVQKALRLGAMDYISKLQLEEDNYHEVLADLAGRMEKRRREQSRSQNQPGKEYCPADRCLIFYSIMPQDIAYLRSSHPDLALLPAREVGQNIHVHFLNGVQEAEDYMAAVKRPWSAVQVIGLRSCELEELEHAARMYYQNHIFYQQAPKSFLWTHFEKVASVTAWVAESEKNRVQEKWLTLTWLYDERLFEELKAQLQRLQLPYKTLLGILVNLENTLMREGKILLNTGTEIPGREEFYCWEDVEEWLNEVFMIFSGTIRSSAYSQEVLAAVTQAVLIVQQEIDRPLLAADVAVRVNMSRSYFSQCFKKITGSSFNQYLRSRRIELAKQYLAQSELTMEAIAERTGFYDEKYFSKVFKAETGRLPSKYRKYKQTVSSRVF